jgi:hypothetical protein
MVKESKKKKALQSFKTPRITQPRKKHHILQEMNLHKFWALADNFHDYHPVVLFIVIQYKFRFSLHLSHHKKKHKVYTYRRKHTVNAYLTRKTLVQNKNNTLNKTMENVIEYTTME